MAPRRVVSSWRRPFTVVYGDNYDYGFNSYGDVMHWLDDKKRGSEKPAPKKYTLEDYIDQHWRFRYGRQLVNDLKEDPNAVSQRLEHIKRASEEVDRRRHKNLARSHTYSAVGKSASEIDEELAATSLLADVDGEAWRHPLRYSGLLEPSEHESHLKNLQEHRRRLAEEIEQEALLNADPRRHTLPRRHHHHPIHQPTTSAIVQAHLDDIFSGSAVRTSHSHHLDLEHHRSNTLDHQSSLRSRADQLLADIATVERNIGHHSHHHHHTPIAHVTHGIDSSSVVRSSHLEETAENVSTGGVRSRDNPRKWYSFPPHFYCVPLKK